MMKIEFTIGDRLICWTYNAEDGYWNRHVNGMADGRHSRGVRTAYEDFDREIEEFNFNARRNGVR